MKITTSGLSTTIMIFLLGIAIFVVFCAVVVLSLTPPVARDALIHHLAIPKLWLKNGGFYETSWASYSYYPMNLDLLYLIPLYFQNDIIPNFIHMAFGLGTAFLIYAYIKNMRGHLAGLFGAFIFISTPVVIRMSTVAYVDLGLTFFVTASVFSFVRWRKSQYEDRKWLLISALAMGLALGVKYNALIVWLFLSFAVVFVYSRDTSRQIPALKEGVLYFAVSLIVFSPWLVKNYMLTGNPLYPLFSGIFNIFNTDSANGAFSLASGKNYIGIFKIREMMYGESFWETLLTPIRFFFQGQDNSDRFFDGVLNPLLIIFVPFAFLKRAYSKNNLLLLFLSIFIILMTFFLDHLRVRYILPAIPFLTVLTVIGIFNIQDWAAGKSFPFRHAVTTALLCLIVFLAGKNFFYLNNYFETVRPLNYVLGSESRDDYIKRHVQSYSAISFINKNTPSESRIRLILLAGRGYYLNRYYEEDGSFGMDIIRKLVEKSGDEKALRQFLQKLDCTHLLVNQILVNRFVKINYGEQTARKLYEQINEVTKKVYEGEGHAVYQINAPL